MSDTDTPANEVSPFDAVAAEVQADLPAAFGSDSPEPVAPEQGEAKDAAPPPTGEETPPPTRTWETVYEELMADDTLKSGYEAHVESVRDESHKKGRAEAQSRLQPMLEQYRAASSSAATALNAIHGEMRKALKEGTFSSDDMDGWIERYKGWVQLPNLAQIQGSYDGAKGLVFLLAKDDPKLAEEYAGRIDAVRDRAEKQEDVASDLLEALVSERVARAVKPKDAEIARLKATIEAAKSESRNGEGPSTASGSTGSGLEPRDESLESLFAAEQKRLAGMRR